MSSGGSGSTTVVNSQPGTPQILPEAKEGYQNAQSFYNYILRQPPIYGGPRVAPLSPGQTSAINQGYDYFGAPQPYQLAAEDQVNATARGDYLTGPQAQQAVTSLSDPIFARFRNETIPQIRDRSVFSGQGLSGSRRVIGNQNAVEDLGRQLALSAYAPVYNQERDRMMTAAGMAPNLLASEATRLSQLSGAGQQERGFVQQLMDTAKQVFEEPLFRQSQAAGSLLSQSGTSPGASTSTSQTTNQTGVADTAVNLGTTALLAYALLAGGKNK